ncbi:hypothetical protein FORC77_3533 [Vibrio vulnificus]|nr:hypothetical protein FORC77_3533 [Vibrio vulnificus]
MRSGKESAKALGTRFTESSNDKQSFLIKTLYDVVIIAPNIQHIHESLHLWDSVFDWID